MSNHADLVNKAEDKFVSTKIAMDKWEASICQSDRHGVHVEWHRFVKQMSFAVDVHEKEREKGVKKLKRALW